MLELNQMYDFIDGYDTIVIHRHVNPDPDALGSQGGLYEILNAAFPNKRILKAGTVPETLQFLSKMDDVTEDDYLHNTLVIVTDTGNEARIDGVHEWMKNATWLKIDHHPNVEHYAPFEYVNTSASSTSEIIYDIYKANTRFMLNDEAAKLLYAGIVGDTGRFLFSNTSSKTLAVASDLLSYSFDFTALNRHFLDVKEPVARLSGYIQEKFDINDEGVASIIVTQDLLKQYGVSNDETASMVGLLGQVDTVQAWGFFIEKEDGTGYRCRLRSKDIPIVDVARCHDGGGHPFACGANAKDVDEIQTIIKELGECVKEATDNA